MSQTTASQAEARRAATVSRGVLDLTTRVAEMRLEGLRRLLSLHATATTTTSAAVATGSNTNPYSSASNDGLADVLPRAASVLAAALPTIDTPAFALAALVFAAYERALARARGADFNSLLSHALALVLTHRSVQGWAGRRFEQVLVDEFQDSNAMQYLLVRAMVPAFTCGGPTSQHAAIALDNHNSSSNSNSNSGTNKSLTVCDAAAQNSSQPGKKGFFVVGDPHQNIYLWRFATPRNMQLVFEDYASAVQVNLRENYRSTPRIVEFCNKIVHATAPPALLHSPNTTGSGAKTNGNGLNNTYDGRPIMPVERSSNANCAALTTYRAPTTAASAAAGPAPPTAVGARVTLPLALQPLAPPLSLPSRMLLPAPCRSPAAAPGPVPWLLECLAPEQEALFIASAIYQLTAARPSPCGGYFQRALCEPREIAVLYRTAAVGKTVEAALRQAAKAAATTSAAAARTQGKERGRG